MQDAKSQEKQLSCGYTKQYLASQGHQEGWVEDNGPAFFGLCAQSCSSAAQWNSWGFIFQTLFLESSILQPSERKPYPHSRLAHSWCLEEAVHLLSVQANLGDLWREEHYFLGPVRGLVTSVQL